MSTYVRPDNGEFIVLGNLKAEGISSSDGDLELGNLGKVRIDNTDNIDLNNIPSSYVNADVALNVAGGSYVAGNSYVGGTFVANGDVVTLGNTGGSLTLGANISSDIIPSQTATYDIGSNSFVWNKVYTNQLISPQFIDCISTASVSYMTDMIQAGSNASISLPDAEPGFIKVFITINTPTNPVTVTPDNPLGFSSITFTNAGDSATLIYGSSGWNVLNLFRATVV